MWRKMAIKCLLRIELIRFGPHLSPMCLVPLFAPILCTGCYESGTVYAPGFSESRFRAIAIGDSKEEVLSTLGPPIRIVGNVFIYRYLKQAVNFTVDSQSGIVTECKFLGKESGIRPKLYEGIRSREQLIKELGPPDKVLGAHRGQSRDPDILSYIYSDEEGYWWKVRVVFIHKTTGKVVDKWSYNMRD